MTNRILMSLRFDVENGDYKPGAINFSNVQVAQIAQGADSRIITLTTSETAITFGVTTHGYLLLRNIGDANALKYGPDSGGAMVPFGRLNPGEIALVRLEPGVVFRAAALASTTRLWAHMESN